MTVEFNVEAYLEALPSNTTDIEITHKGLTRCPDLLRFGQLVKLTLDHNLLTELPPLPATLRDLHCGNNRLTELPPLPDYLRILNCESNPLAFLPPLPARMKHLYCSKNKLEALPPLPPELIELVCSHTNITELPPLPPTLTYLYCGRNNLSKLPPLPPTLTYLYCASTQLTCLPPLPDGLLTLMCVSNEKLLFLPMLPAATNAWRVYTNNPHLIYHQLSNIGIGAQSIKQLINAQNIILRRFKFTFYCLKYKRQLREWLWDKVRRPNVERRYHPDNVIRLLEEGVAIDDLDQYL